MDGVDSTSAEPESNGLHFVPHQNISVPNGDAKVDQFNPHVEPTLEHDVVRFYVSVYNTNSTEGFQSHEQLKMKELPFFMSHKIKEALPKTAVLLFIHVSFPELDNHAAEEWYFVGFIVIPTCFAIARILLSGMLLGLQIIK